MWKLPWYEQLNVWIVRHYPRWLKRKIEKAEKARLAPDDRKRIDEAAAKRKR
jgi:hypothetical protein